MHLLHCFILAGLASLTYGPHASWGGSPSGGELIFEKVEGNRLHFKGFELKTPAFELEWLGLLPGSGDTPSYALYAGNPCKSANCAEARSLYLQRIDPPGASEKPSPANAPLTHSLPGLIRDPKKNEVHFESRTFFGRCLTSTPKPVLVSFQKERVDRRRGLQSTVFIAEPGPLFARERLLMRGLPSLQVALNQVKRKECTEIPRRNRNILARPLDLRPKRGVIDSDAEEDEEEEEVAEKQENGTQPEAAPGTAPEAASDQPAP